MSAFSLRSGWIATGVAVAFALVLLALVLVRIDKHPRTHVAYIYADTTEIAPEVSGRLLSIDVRENQFVRAGDVLVHIDPEPFEMRVRQSRAQVAALEAQLSVGNRKVTSQLSGADAAQTNIAKARTQLQLADDTLRRLGPLVGPGYVTQQQFDEATSNRQAAAAALDIAIQQAAEARQGVGDTDSLVAQIDAARQSVLLAERDLRLTRVLAPIDGIVTGLTLSRGSYASTGRPLFTLIDREHWYAVANFRETELRHISSGDPAEVWLINGSTRSLRGHVQSLGHGVDDAGAAGPGLPSIGRSLDWVVIAQRFPVRIALDAPPPQLMRIGATATVVVDNAHAR